MGLITRALVAFVCIFGLTAGASPKAPAADDGFKNYADGAMVVYSKFKEPSKVESEQFYQYIQARWNSENCKPIACKTPGIQAATEYAMLQKIELDL